MGAEGAFYQPRKTGLNLGLSCLVAGEIFIQSNAVNESSRVPCAVSCVARLIDLRRLRHQNVALYLDAQYDIHHSIYVVAEYYASNFSQLNPPVKSLSDFSWLLQRFGECISALTYLESQGVVHGCLNPSCLLIDNFDNLKVSGHGTFYASRWGKDLGFPVVDLHYSSPEMLLYCQSPMPQETSHSVDPPPPLDSRSDLWSAALIFTELLHAPLKTFDSKILLESLTSSLNTTHSFIDYLISPNSDEATQLKKWISALDGIYGACLVLDSRRRGALAEISARFSETFNHAKIVCFENESDTKNGENGRNACQTRDYEKALAFLQSRDDPAESYYYWQLAGGGADLAATFLRGVNGTEYIRPPILSLPIVLYAVQDSRCTSIEIWPRSGRPIRPKYCSTVVPLPADRLLARLSRMPESSLYPLLHSHTYSVHTAPALNHTDGDASADDGSSRHQPFIVKESLSLTGLEGEGSVWNGFRETDHRRVSAMHLPKHELRTRTTHDDSTIFQPVLVKQADVEYQVTRVCLLRRLLRGMPATAPRILLEARFDVPPFLRAEIWSALLGVGSGYSDDTDRRRIEAALSVATLCGSRSGVGLSDQMVGQISVDLPRCHAYDLLIGSPLGQQRLRSVLVAALLANGDRFEYTQGMDSLAAVFTRLCFGSPTSVALATHCLSNLLRSRRRLVGAFFARRRFTAGLRAHFGRLLRLLAFHEPALAAHFARLAVPLTGLTAGWMYTLMAHSMPLARTEILWDSLLAAPPALPMLVYVAVFHQVKHQCGLLSLNQESICTLLSNFPDFNLDQCLEDALAFAAATPLSLVTSDGTDCPAEGDATEGWMDSLTRALQAFNQTHHKMVVSSELHERAHCVHCLSAWPTHMDVVAGASNGRPLPREAPASPPATDRGRYDVDYRVLNSSLVALIEPWDALQQLARSDCILVDMRSKEDYTSGCLLQSIHYPPSYDVDTGLVYLTGSQLWIEATAARNAAATVIGTAAHSPGLVILLQQQQRLRSSNDNDVDDDEGAAGDCCFALAAALIENAIDRVCVVRGGARALFSLPQIADFFVSPRI